jgi:hypothetical protein
MNEPTHASALRAILKKDGEADIRLEVRRRSEFDFEVLENGNPVKAAWRALSPQEAISGTAKPLTLQQAWENSVSQFPDYAVTNLEELS